MNFIEQFIDPRTAAILRITFGKILQRMPLSLCMILSVAVVTYTFTFSERMVEGGALVFALLLTTLLAITTSFALEYDTKDELMLLINLGVSPTDIFRLGLFRVLVLSLLGFIIGVLLVLITPISIIKNVMVFYAFLVTTALGILPPLYSSLKSMHVSFLGRVAFKPLMEKEVPVIVTPSELEDIKNYVEERLKDRQDIIIISISKNEDLTFTCKYLGDFGRETFAMLTSLGINPDAALRSDDTLPMVVVKVKMRGGKKPILECWEGKDKSHKKRSSLALSFQALIRQMLIEYRVYKGGLRGAEFRT
ncbi:MAG: hypothetical protein ACUVQ5_05355 [Candidatus Methanomethylicaceae archaeon]